MKCEKCTNEGHHGIIVNMKDLLYVTERELQGGYFAVLCTHCLTEWSRHALQLPALVAYSEAQRVKDVEAELAAQQELFDAADKWVKGEPNEDV